MAAHALAAELGVPFVQSFHTLGAMKNQRLAPGQRPEPAVRLLGERFLAGRADAVVAVSAAEAASLIDEAGAAADRTVVIPPGVDVTLFRPGRAVDADARVRAEWGIGAAQPIIAVVGRVQPLKDQLLAVRAMAELRQLGGPAPMLLIAGSATPGDGDYLESLRRIADELGVADSVRFVGALTRQELADVLAVAALTLIPSYSGDVLPGGARVRRERHTGGRVPGHRDSSSRSRMGGPGVLLDSREPRAWAQSIRALLDDAGRPHGPLRFRQGARARVHLGGFGDETARRVPGTARPGTLKRFGHSRQYAVSGRRISRSGG